MPGDVGRCRDCEHWWAFDDDGLGGPVGSLACDRARLGLCKTIKGPQDRRDTRKVVELAAVEDASGYQAHLRTAADFGCVMFERRT